MLFIRCINFLILYVSSFFQRSSEKAAISTNHQTVFSYTHDLIIQFIWIGIRIFRTILYF